jgi:ubiquinone/menaquinone biosynthesis C-methylase UbiE
MGSEISRDHLDRIEAGIRQKYVSFQNTAGHNLPFPADTFDVAISNGVINLIPDKEGALTEIHRVLNHGGRLMVADQVAVGRVQKDIQARLANWFH